MYEIKESLHWFNNLFNWNFPTHFISYSNNRGEKNNNVFI